MRSESEQRRLLERVLGRRCPDLLYVAFLADGRQLPTDVQESIHEAILGELVEEGLRSDDEPNAYGLRLESLLDWVLSGFTRSYD